MIHIGVDVWGTLLFPSTDYSEYRKMILITKLVETDRYKVSDIEHVKVLADTILKDAALMESKIDQFEQRNGVTISCDLKWNTLMDILHGLKLFDNIKHYIKWREELRIKLTQYFHVDVHWDLVNLLNATEKSECRIFVLTNTGKISSKDLRKILTNAGLRYDALYGSDEIGYVKPVMIEHLTSSLKHLEVMIGDDPTTDGLTKIGNTNFYQYNKGENLHFLKLLLKELNVLDKNYLC